MHSIITWLVSSLAVVVSVALALTLALILAKCLMLFFSYMFELPRKFLLLFTTENKVRAITKQTGTFLAKTFAWLSVAFVVLTASFLFVVCVDLVRRLIFH